MRRLRDDAWVVFLAIIFYGSYAWDQYYPPASATSLTPAFVVTLISLAGLAYVLGRAPLDRWIYVISALVPLEISGCRWIFPSLSPIDYLCAVALISWLSRIGFSKLVSVVRETFGIGALLAWSAFYLFGIFDAHHSGGSIRGLLRWGEFLFCFVLAVSATKEPYFSQKHFASLLVWSGTIFSASAVAQFFLSHGDYTQTYATFHQHNGFGAYASLCAPAAWGVIFSGNPRSRPIKLLSALIISVAFLLAYSRGAWMGMLFGIGVTIVSYPSLSQVSRSTRHRIVFMLLLSFMSLSVILPLALIRTHPHLGVMQWTLGIHTKELHPTPPITHHFSSSAQRPYYWRAAYTIMQKHPYLGMGPGLYDTDLPKYLNPTAVDLYDYELHAKHHADFWSHLHSMYLQILVQYGGIGFFLWIVALTTLVAPRLSMAIESPPSALSFCFLVSVIAFFVHNTVDILFVNSLDLLMVFILVFSA